MYLYTLMKQTVFFVCLKTTLLLSKKIKLNLNPKGLIKPVKKYLVCLT